MPRFLSSLRVRLLLLVLVTAVPGMGLILYEGFEQWKLATDVSEQRALDHAREISREHERLIQGGQYLLQALAEITSVRAHDGKSCNRLFSKMVKAQPTFTNLGAAKPDGDVFCSAIPLTQPVNFADRPYFQQALRTRDLAVSEYLVGRISGRPNITISYPALDNSGVVQAVVIAGLSLDWFNKFVAESQLPQGSVATLTDHNGMILARYPEPEKWIGKLAADTPVFKAMLTHPGEGVVEAADLDGARRLYGFTKLSGLGPGRNIYVSVGIPEEIVFSEATRIFYRDLILIGIVMLLSLAGVWFGAGQLITRPVDELVGATKRLAAGDLSARSGLPRGEGELNQLARSFNQMAESLRRITHRNELILNSAGEGIFGLDCEEKATFVNPAAAEMLGHEVEQLIGKPTHSIFHQFRPDGTPYPSEECLIYAAFKDGTTHHITDEVFWKKDGTSFPVEYISTPIKEDGKLTGAVVTFKDVTERKRAEEQLKKQAEELKTAIAEMEISNKVKDQFLSVMSHELRTPLNVVLGYTGMLRDGMLGEIPPKQKEVLSKVINRSNDLLTLIRDILYATQIESRSVIVERQLVNLSDFLDRLKAGYDQPLNKDLTLNWNYPADLPPAITDSEKLKQILRNLIHNAIKFTEKGSVTISAKIRQQAKGKEQVEFKVADTGIGVPKEILPFIFEKFRQADSSETRIYGGVGLGLYIVKNFTAMLGGTVEVESEPGKGSIFTVTLPLEQ